MRLKPCKTNPPPLWHKGFIRKTMVFTISASWFRILCLKRCDDRENRMVGRDFFKPYPVTFDFQNGFFRNAKFSGLI